MKTNPKECRYSRGTSIGWSEIQTIRWDERHKRDEDDDECLTCLRMSPIVPACRARATRPLADPDRDLRGVCRVRVNGVGGLHRHLRPLALVAEAGYGGDLSVPGADQSRHLGWLRAVDSRHLLARPPFPFRPRWMEEALAVHAPASLVITTLHLMMVGMCRYYLQGVRGGNPELITTLLDAFFRTVDQTLPLYWAIIGLQHAVDYSRQARARELRAARLETRLIESQMQALHQQLHPHFLFNTLHAISTLVHRDPDKADLMIERLSDLLRITLAEGRRAGSGDGRGAGIPAGLPRHRANPLRPAAQNRIPHRRGRPRRDGAHADPAAAGREFDPPRARTDSCAAAR